MCKLFSIALAAIGFGLSTTLFADAENVTESFRDCDDCPELVAIAGGAFEMGSSQVALETAGVPEPFASYQMPKHAVNITRDFAIGKYPITKMEFQRFVSATGYQLDAGCWSWNQPAVRYEQQQQLTWQDPGFPQAAMHPAVCVNWDDAKAYIAWLSKRAKLDYRLPTESEREYVTRGSASTAWPWGSARRRICEYANVSDLSRLAVHTATQRSTETVFDCEDGFVYTAPVGSLAPNRFGLYDTLGNVWEWVEDCFQPTYAESPTDGTALYLSDCPQRTLRGGSWFTLTFLNRPTARYGAAHGDRSGHIGFRIARTLE